MAQWILYAIAVGACVVPAFIAWRYAKKLGEAQAKSEAEKSFYENRLRILRKNYDDLESHFTHYRKIVETSGDTPAAIIDRLRKQNNIN